MNVSIMLKQLNERGNKIAYIVLDDGSGNNKNLEAFIGDDSVDLLNIACTAAKKHIDHLYNN